MGTSQLILNVFVTAQAEGGGIFLQQGRKARSMRVVAGSTVAIAGRWMGHLGRESGGQILMADETCGLLVHGSGAHDVSAGEEQEKGSDNRFGGHHGVFPEGDESP